MRKMLCILNAVICQDLQKSKSTVYYFNLFNLHTYLIVWLIRNNNDNSGRAEPSANRRSCELSLPRGGEPEGAEHAAHAFHLLQLIQSEGRRIGAAHHSR